MAKRHSAAHDDPFADLDRKTQILERELALQQAAMERLRTLARPGRREGIAEDIEAVPAPVRQTA